MLFVAVLSRSVYVHVGFVILRPTRHSCSGILSIHLVILSEAIYSIETGVRGKS